MPSLPQACSGDDGRERFGRNVAFAWGGYLVNVASGFVVPRLISDHLGQSVLGIWDFAWSFVAYFGLVQLGLGGSIGHYVAHYRANRDSAGLNRSVSTIAVFQRSVGWLSLVLAIVSAWVLLPLFEARLGQDLATARWVLLILGTEVAFTVMLAVYGSVITGCHRWDMHNCISAIAYATGALGMIGVLLSGGGLPALALLHCIVMVASELVRWSLVKRVCPELVIQRSLASWDTFVEQVRYSIKSLIPSVSGLLSNQALSLLIVAFLGPASLAVFSRSRALMTTLRMLAVKFGMIVVPTASTLHARKDLRGLQDTLLGPAAIISSLVLPVLTAIGFLGDHLIRLWMGDAYVLNCLLPILCAGTYATLVQEPVWSLLSGMDMHGPLALAKLGAAIASALLLTLGLWYFHWGLLGAAACFAFPQVLVDGLLTPWYASRVLGVPQRIFFWRVMLRPIACVMPFALALKMATQRFEFHPCEATGTVVIGTCVSAWAYWRWLVSPKLKLRLQGNPRKWLPKGTLAAVPEHESQ